LFNLDSDPFALSADGFSEVAQLFAHNIIDCFASTFNVFANGFANIAERDVVGDLLTALACRLVSACTALACPTDAIATVLGGPARTRCRPIAGPPCAFNARERSPFGAFASGRDQRPYRAAAAWTCSKKQGDHCSDRGAQKRGGQKIELLLALTVRVRPWA